MKHEIKFRGKRKLNGEWVYGFYFHWLKRGKALHIIGVGVQNGSVIGWEVDPDTVGQYIGRQDDSASDIFSGDTVNFRQHPRPAFTGTVVYHAKSARFLIEYFANDIERARNYPSYQNFGSLNTCKVIGAIHDNPELLKPMEGEGI